MELFPWVLIMVCCKQWTFQVSNLIILNEASVQDQHAFPDLVSSAEHIFQTVCTLTHTGFKLAQESSDEVI